MKALLVRKPKLKNSWEDSMAEQKGCRIIRDPDPDVRCGVPPRVSNFSLTNANARDIDIGQR